MTTIKSANLVRVADLLTRAYPKRENAEADRELISTANQLVWTAIVSPVSEMTVNGHEEMHLQNRFSALLAAANNPKLNHLQLAMDPYWCAAFEALLVAYYDGSPELAQGARHILHNQLPWCRWTPHVMIGFIRASAWQRSRYNNEANVAFAERFPRILGCILVDFAYQTNNHIFHTVNDPSPWIISQFSAALADYLSVRDIHLCWSRCQELCRALAQMKYIGKHAAPFVSEITGRLMYKLSDAARLEMVTKFYLEEAPGHGPVSTAQACVYRGEPVKAATEPVA